MNNSKDFIDKDIKQYDLNYQHGKLLNDLGLKLTYKKIRRQHIVHSSEFYKFKNKICKIESEMIINYEEKRHY